MIAELSLRRMQALPMSEWHCEELSSYLSDYRPTHLAAGFVSIISSTGVMAPIGHDRVRWQYWLSMEHAGAVLSADIFASRPHHEPHHLAMSMLLVAETTRGRLVGEVMEEMRTKLLAAAEAYRAAGVIP